MIVKTITTKEFVEGRSMIVIPEPSEETIEKFKKVMKIKVGKKTDVYLMSDDHCSALITKEMNLDDLRKHFIHDERIYAGFWRFDGEWVRRKRHNEMNIGIRTDDGVFVYSADRLADALKVAGNKVHLYICRPNEDVYGGWGFLLVLSDKCGICLAPIKDEYVRKEGYQIIGKVAQLIHTSDSVKDQPSDGFFDEFSEREALKLIERLSRELGILHM